MMNRCGRCGSSNTTTREAPAMGYEDRGGVNISVQCHDCQRRSRAFRPVDAADAMATWRQRPSDRGTFEVTAVTPGTRVELLREGDHKPLLPLTYTNVCPVCSHVWEASRLEGWCPKCTLDLVTLPPVDATDHSSTFIAATEQPAPVRIEDELIRNAVIAADVTLHEHGLSLSDYGGIQRWIGEMPGRSIEIGDGRKCRHAVRLLEHGVTKYGLQSNGPIGDIVCEMNAYREACMRCGRRVAFIPATTDPRYALCSDCESLLAWLEKAEKPRPRMRSTGFRPEYKATVVARHHVPCGFRDRAPSHIDGRELNPGDILLLTAQNQTANNGLWFIQGAGVAASRWLHDDWFLARLGGNDPDTLVEVLHGVCYEGTHWFHMGGGVWANMPKSYAGSISSTAPEVEGEP